MDFFLHNFNIVNNFIYENVFYIFNIPFALSFGKFLVSDDYSIYLNNYIYYNYHINFNKINSIFYSGRKSPYFQNNIIYINNLNNYFYFINSIYADYFQLLNMHDSMCIRKSFKYWDLGSFSYFYNINHSFYKYYDDKRCMDYYNNGILIQFID